MPKLLLSIDWDAYSGCAEFVFDAPIWGTPDREHERVQRWHERLHKRGAASWAELEGDFPLYGGWHQLTQYAGLPSYSAWSHAHAWEWLERYPGREVLNIDSHHDLYSHSGDAAQVRPGNWAGLGLQARLITRYAAQYPTWHAGLAVAEGHDLGRTWQELEGAIPTLLPRVQLERSDALPPRHTVEAVLLVQSPAWTSPAHDGQWLDILKVLEAIPLSPSYDRR